MISQSLLTKGNQRAAAALGALGNADFATVMDEIDMQAVAQPTRDRFLKRDHAPVSTADSREFQDD